MMLAIIHKNLYLQLRITESPFYEQNVVKKKEIMYSQIIILPVVTNE